MAVPVVSPRCMSKPNPRTRFGTWRFVVSKSRLSRATSRKFKAHRYQEKQQLPIEPPARCPPLRLLFLLSILERLLLLLCGRVPRWRIAAMDLGG
jgi:hypothetical protein